MIYTDTLQTVIMVGGALVLMALSKSIVKVLMQTLDVIEMTMTII